MKKRKRRQASEREQEWRHRERYQGRAKNNHPRSKPLPPGLLEQWKPSEDVDHR